MNEQTVKAAALRMIAPGTTDESYEGDELKLFTGRPGANDALEMPSRFGNELRYRDGRVEMMA